MDYTYPNLLATYQELLNDRSEWDSSWRQVSEWLLPGRGVFQTFTTPRKRKLTNANIVNNTGEEALYDFTAELAGRLTSPDIPWFKLDWPDKQLNAIAPLRNWLMDCSDLLHQYLHSSNFYGVMDPLYNEYVGFATIALYNGEDSETTEAPFRFEVLTVGEYAFSLNHQAKPDMFFRTVFMTERQLYQRFPETVSKEVKKKIENGETGVNSKYVTVLECVYPEKILGKKYTRVFYETNFVGQRIGMGDANLIKSGEDKEPLEKKGFNEFPYHIARWGVIGSDTYGLGPGQRAIPHVKRLQEMEKAHLRAVHLEVDPPLNIPTHMYGKVNRLPGGDNYYRNPQEKITRLIEGRTDNQGIQLVKEGIEQQLKKIFFNDLFLTANRNPNATPYKATEVNARESEKLVRLGPVVVRLNNEFFQPLINRCFNICLRKNLFPAFPAGYEKQVDKYRITLISPLAVAQKGVALQGIQTFLGFVGQAAQFDQRALDKVDIDGAIDEFAHITGVNHRVLNDAATVQQIRKGREQQLAQEKAKQEQVTAMQAKSEMDAKAAQAAKAQSEAGLNYLEGQDQAQSMSGMI